MAKVTSGTPKPVSFATFRSIGGST